MLYARQVAWLNAPVKGKDGSRKNQGVKAEYPKLDAGEYLLDWLFEAGPGLDGKPLTWADLNGWAAATRTAMTAFEAVTLRRLSVCYMDAYNAANDPACPAPYRTTIDRAAVDAGFRNLARRMKAR